MVKRRVTRLISTAFVVTAVAFGVSGTASVAQTPAPQGKGVPNGTVPPTPPSDDQAKPGSGPSKPQLGKVLPDSPAERAKVLDDLYAHLATAPDEATAKPYSEAIERLWQAPGSDTVIVLMDRATNAAQHDRNDLALQLLTAVTELAPDYAEAWNRRAYVFYTEGDYERSLGDLRRVLALDPSHYKALDGLGQIMRQLDRKDQALKIYERLQQVNPNWPNLNTTLEELRRDVEGRAL